jgi:Mlc titration factor MtfA (ptsG expression regulator)
VILSWEDVAAALDGADYNVVVHEFAHQLDYDAPGTVGAPALADYRDWAAAFSEAFEILRRDGSPVIDPYGAEDPAEFFAVAVEAFIQCPDELAAAHPDLYRVLADYLAIDPARGRKGPRAKAPRRKETL